MATCLIALQDTWEIGVGGDGYVSFEQLVLSSMIWVLGIKSKGKSSITQLTYGTEHKSRFQYKKLIIWFSSVNI